MDVTLSLEEYTEANNKDIESKRKAIFIEAKGREYYKDIPSCAE